MAGMAQYTSGAGALKALLGEKSGSEGASHMGLQDALWRHASKMFHIVSHVRCMLSICMPMR